MHCSIIVIASA